MAKKKTKPAPKRVAQKTPKPTRKKPAKATRKAAPKPPRKIVKRKSAATANKKKPAPAMAAPLPAALMELLEKAWPNYLVDFAQLNFDSSYLAQRIDQVRGALHGVELGGAFHERGPIIGDKWMADDMAELPSEGDFPRSYHLFFVGPKGGEFEGPCETVVDNDMGESITVRGQFRWGWTIAISFVSPVAALVPDTIAVYPNGMIDYLELNLHFHEDDAPDDAGGAQARLSPEAWRKLLAIRTRIAEALDEHGIEILGRETLGTPVERLKAGEHALIDSDRLRVKDAFFFRFI